MKKRKKRFSTLAMLDYLIRDRMWRLEDKVGALTRRLDKLEAYQNYITQDFYDINKNMKLKESGL
jgi:hypothetical protein